MQLEMLQQYSNGKGKYNQISTKNITLLLFRDSVEGITNPKLPATLKTKMDEQLEEFCRKITPSQQLCDELNQYAEVLIRLLKQKSRFPPRHWKLLGGFDSKTFIAKGLEVVIYSNSSNKADVLNDFEEVLLLNSEVAEVDIIKTASSLSFSFKELPCKVYVATLYYTDMRKLQAKLMNDIQQRNNPLEVSKYYEAELTIVRNDWLNNQTEFTKDIIRLSNYWNNSILWFKHIPERSLVFELLAVKTAREELEKTAFPHHKKTFVKFLQKVQYLQDQIVMFEDYYTMREVPTAPLILDPVNPTLNICRDLGPNFYQMFSMCATTTLQVFDSGSANLQKIFFPQPLLWKLLENERFEFKPRNYIIGIEFYSSQIPKSVIRTRANSRNLIENMLNERSNSFLK